ncbi:hypothetical protein B0T11DRAFT_53886 [Plectosphaerella cucumerina]|uniref:Uncharacterized protein n=1 Tax=Plectosphaerella cucumerina TaxID=40658 RepID=A0A8K0TLN7_9PEZI|nr:hypothetical protein B0T11DRAFT_53886 [Plectosphaerella cucumerina]
MSVECFLIPPYLLRSLATADDLSDHAKELAQQALSHFERVAAAHVELLRLQKAAIHSNLEGPGPGGRKDPGKPKPKPKPESIPAALREVYDMANSESESALPGKLVRKEGDGEMGGESSDEAVNAVFDNVGRVLAMFQDKFDWIGIDDNGNSKDDGPNPKDDDIPDDDVPNDEPPKDEPPKDGIPKDDIPKDDIPKDDGNPEDPGDSLPKDPGDSLPEDPGDNIPKSGGTAIVSSVHFGKEYENAYWDPRRRQFVFGDGGEFLGNFTSAVDVIGHELTHGVTEHVCPLAYMGMSGALNEHISDVFGIMAKQIEEDETAEKADWLIGEACIMPGVKGTALRSMKAPGTAYDDPRFGKDPQPDHFDDYVPMFEDMGGVHIYSGIPNKAFWLVATKLGGYTWEKAGQI